MICGYCLPRSGLHFLLLPIVRTSRRSILPKEDIGIWLRKSIARDGIEKPRSMLDPDGNRVRLVPPGYDGISQIAITMGVRSLSEHRIFYGNILGFAEQAPHTG
jgi:hypothetical protein